MNEVEIPRDFIPIIEWHKRLNPKQMEFIKSTLTFWETLFVAGNGTGKTRVLYLSLIEIAIGIHPWCSAKNVEPPFKIKVLLNDFEHGLEIALGAEASAYKVFDYSDDSKHDQY